ncbi:MAG: hypothetical protein QOK29_218, partial [Rhodospirillaceae bacterium]|nr:hypothetical protein [Rhodospirillaceae bacterium]
MADIQLTAITKHFGDVTAVSELSLGIEGGERLIHQIDGRPANQRPADR